MTLRRAKPVALLLAGTLALAAASGGCGDSKPSAEDREGRLAEHIANTVDAERARCHTIAWGDGRHFTCVVRVRGWSYWLGVALSQAKNQPVITSVDCSRQSKRRAGVASACFMPESLATAFGDR